MDELKCSLCNELLTTEEMFLERGQDEKLCLSCVREVYIDSLPTEALGRVIAAYAR